MFVISFITPPPGFELGFWHRTEVLRAGGLALTILSGILRCGRKTALRNNDWPKVSELLLLIGLAFVVTAADTYFSQRIGLLASPPVYDGVAYMSDAKQALLELDSWKERPIHAVNVMMGNRYPVWMTLLVLNFGLFGVGEWQAYAVRFWPTLLILAATFWVVRRHAGAAAGWAAALFAALLPTLSLNLRSAAVGQQLYPSGYLTDLRPDLLFACLLMLAVVLVVEHAHAFDERTAILAGTCAGLAALVKTSAMSAVFLACGLAGSYVLLNDRRNWGRHLLTSLWALLAFALLVVPWMLAGGLELIIVYLRELFTIHLSLYTNPNPTFRSEATYYLPLLVSHMGWETVALILACPLLLAVAAVRRRAAASAVRPALVYAGVGAALYALVSASPAKNYFLGLPSYLFLWIFCWLAASTVIASWPALTNKLGGGLLAVAIALVSVTGVLGVRGLNSWQGREFAEGSRDRAVMQQIAVDLREVLSNDQYFFTMPAYGNPAALLFYMPDHQGRLPGARIIDGLKSPPVDVFLQEEIEVAKAVLIYADGNKESSFKGYMPPFTFPYFRAVADWLQRPGSDFHLRKTYQFYRAAGGDQAAIQLYVRDDSQ